MARRATGRKRDAATTYYAWGGRTSTPPINFMKTSLARNSARSGGHHYELVAQLAP
jgi:hypothetical protein